MGCILTKCVMVLVYFSQKVSILYMVRFLHKTELLFVEPVLVSALLDKSLEFKNFHMGVVCWQEVDNLFLGVRSQ